MKRKSYLIVLIFSLLLASCGPELEPGVILIGRNLSNKDLAGVDLRKANLYHTNLSGTNLSGANLQDTSLSEADLTEADLSGANLQGANLSKAKMTGANLDGAILDGANLSEARGLSGEILSNVASLSGANLEGATLSGAVFQDDNLSGTNLQDADLSEANLQGANLSESILQNANLSKANLTNANLSEANLQKATLTNANLTGVRLQDADLTKANLSGVTLDDAILDNAILSNVEGLTEEMLSSVASRINTRLVSVDEIREMLTLACDGTGVPEAATYHQEPGIHPIAIIGKSGLAPEAWLPLSIQSTELVACVEEEQQTLIETCEYEIVSVPGGNGKYVTPKPQNPENLKYTIERYRTDVPIRLVEAQTGNMVAEIVLTGAFPEICSGFEITEQWTNQETRYGKLPSASDIQNWLEPYVLGIAPPIELAGHNDAITSASFSPDSKHIITTSNDKTARLWDTTGNLIAVLDDLKPWGFMRSASFSPNGKYIVTASLSYGTADGSLPDIFHIIGLWDIDGNLIAMPGGMLSVGGRGLVVSAASFSPDSTRIVLPGNNFTAQVWDMEGNSLITLSGHTDNVISANYSLDGNRIVTGSTDGTARLWDADGNQLAVLRDHDRTVIFADFVPDGSHILTVDLNGQGRLWDLDGNLIVKMEHSMGNAQISFRPDSKFIALAMRTVQIWTIEGEIYSELSDHSGSITLVSFSPNGDYLVTGSNDTTAWVWDIEGMPLDEIKGHSAPLTVAIFSPDGTLILTAGGDGRAQIHNVKFLLENAVPSPE